MSITRRLFTSSSRSLSALVEAKDTLPIAAYLLPPAIYKLVQSHIRQIDTISITNNEPLPDIITMPNPMIHQKKFLPPISTIAPGDDRVVHIPPQISRRRQKAILASYSPDLVPASADNPNSNPLVEWYDGRIVEFSGEFEMKEKKGVYGSRRRMFKGHKHEREAPARRKETEDRLEGMAKRIAEWKRAKSETVNSTRPSLPF